MSTCAWNPAQLLPWWAELRIDVQLPPWSVESDLRRLQQRMQRPGDALGQLAAIELPVPGFAFRHRQADGEHYVYVEDLACGRLAGYTVFNRLVELSRRADPHLRSPHSRYGHDYQRRGLASAVYRWALQRGMCLITGRRQSRAAHALWTSLSRQHELGYVLLEAKRLRWLGHRVDPDLLGAFHTRMVLLGEGWSCGHFCEATGADRAALAQHVGESG
ncbi:N-acetyltransferase [Ramlibacter humi]|uniref:N-acetyltransferase n=2 Tax=Ramlibacter humi TaxID=2530451 RepID=A0A4Z0BMF6_9BURK|nr:N-acetyltransferase [Ramlibacter humi]TFY99128.1 N-acetyltransferase [Ramlibacter humi]